MPSCSAVWRNDRAARAEFLTREIVDAIDEEQIDTFGGLRGFRDENALESAIAAAQNFSVEALLQRLMSERGATARVAGIAPELPVWHLGDIGPLHRRDIYDDVR